MTKIEKISAQEILDSRDNPTLRVDVLLSDGSIGEASVPSGASTGKYEAHELRDNDKARYGGMGVLKAVNNVEGELFMALKGKDVFEQETIDRTLIEVDGTDDKSRLGANAILGVSLAVARAAAVSLKLELYRYIRKLSGYSGKEYILPRPMMNVVNGGRHADSGLDIQEYMLIPSETKKFSEQLRLGVEIFDSLAEILKRRGFSTAVGDEGGYAPRLESNENVFSLLTDAVLEANYKIKDDVDFGIDAAASEFYDDTVAKYLLNKPKAELNREELLDLYSTWIEKYPLISIEDPLSEDDWEGWSEITKRIGSKQMQIVGDDFFVTNIERLQKGINIKAANAILIKVNQIGTLTETLRAINLAQKNNYGVIISHRSGETADTFIADLAVGINAGQIKTGSLSRSERVEKYNRLLAIEKELG